MHSSRKNLIRAMLTILLLAFCQSAGYTQKQWDKEGLPPGRYAEMIYLRMISIAQSVLQLEQQTIERLTARKMVDRTKFHARIISARLQMQKLMRLGTSLEKSMASSDPARAKLESLRQRLFYFIAMHKKNIEQIITHDDFKDLPNLSSGIIEVIEKNAGQDQIKHPMIGNLYQAL